MGEDTKIMNKWEKAKIIGNLSIAFILAAATILGSTYIPNKINKHSLEAQWINELSQLVPRLYDSSAVVRPSVIAMASYGVPAVPLLLLVLEDAICMGNNDMIKTIVSTMKYMDDDSKKEVRTRLEMEIVQLDQRNLEPYNLRLIGQMVSILQWPRLFDGSSPILERYFSIVSKFTENKIQLPELNRIVLKALSDNGFNISRLQLQGLDFSRKDLSGIDFRNTRLKNTILIESEIDGCKFEGAILESCNMSGAFFFTGHEDTLTILNTFEELAKSNWRNATLDTPVYNILRELDKDPRNIEKLRAMAGDIKEGF